MKNQVLSIKQMQKLESLGVDTSKASMHWVCLPTADAIMNGTDELSKEPDIFVNTKGITHEHPAFTLQDILEMLPKEITEPVTGRIARLATDTLPDKIGMCYLVGSYLMLKDFMAVGKDWIECAFNMLVWIFENGYLKGGAE